MARCSPYIFFFNVDFLKEREKNCETLPGSMLATVRWYREDGRYGIQGEHNALRLGKSVSQSSDLLINSYLLFDKVYYEKSKALQFLMPFKIIKIQFNIVLCF